MNKTQSIAGMSLGGGKKENFFFCLFEFFEDQDRWFLTSLKQVKDEVDLDRDEVITSWINDYSLKRLVVDFPLTKPICESCSLECPGVLVCHHPVVKTVRSHMDTLLVEDLDLKDENPKKYEQSREKSNQLSKKRVIKTEEGDELLSKSFKRKLKKGFLPYWNRPVDFWIWKNYYDEILNYFSISYDSFGNVSLMLMNRFKYLLKHFPSELALYESNTYMILIELLKANIVLKKDIDNLSDMEEAPLARVKITKCIEKKLGIFIYSKDLEYIAQNTKAFDSFLLAVSGHNLVLKKNKAVDSFGEQSKVNLIAPDFS